MSLKNYIIHFHFLKEIKLLRRRIIKRFLSEQLQKAGKSGASINIIFCSDEEILKINQNHLQHDYYTDIITFDLSDETSSFLISDIYISVDRVIDNAKNMFLPVSTEVLRVIFHGVLHLIGYKDKSDKQQKEMRSMEDLWLQEFASFS